MKGEADIDGPGGIYFARLSAPMFPPSFIFAAYQPARRGAWRLQVPVFDYRAAQNSGALEPRDGPWYSRSELNLVGPLGILWPVSAAGLPGPIGANIRLSRFPAHVTFTWQDGGAYRKTGSTASRWNL